MKKLWMITLAIILNSIAYGQVSESIVAENKVWSNLWQAASGSPLPHEMETTFIRFSSDTTIGNETYKMVLESTDEYQTTFTIIGFIREDQDKKVYYRGKNETESRLLYDFGAEVGDSLNIGSSVLVVETIDSVPINYQYKKRMVLSNSGIAGEQWIEGIGSLCGILASGNYCITGGKFDLLCFFEDDTLVYSNPEFLYCYYNTTGTGEPDVNMFSVEVVPNPVVSSSLFRINGDLSPDFMIEIYTLQGVKIKTILPDKSSLVLRREDYSSGIYILRLLQKDSVSISGKFIVR